MSDFLTYSLIVALALGSGFCGFQLAVVFADRHAIRCCRCNFRIRKLGEDLHGGRHGPCNKRTIHTEHGHPANPEVPA